MAAVPQKTLNWLYNVLNGVYRDANRTYSDLAQTLARYPSLSPRTDVYTFENGTSALLAHFVGTLPVSFRGATYRFPIALWIPHGYPYEAPLVYVTPTEDMLVRPGQHVAGDGRVYHHYLAHWRDAWDRSNIVDFLSILSDIFAKEPPVMSKQQMTLGSHGQAAPGNPPPRPPLPQDLQRQRPPSQNMNAALGSSGAPPPPPKQPSRPPTESRSPEPARPGRYDAPPPLPGQSPRPSNLEGPARFHQNGEVGIPTNSSQYTPQRASTLRQHSAQDSMSGSTGQHQPWAPHPQMPPHQTSLPGPPLQPGQTHPSFHGMQPNVANNPPHPPQISQYPPPGLPYSQPALQQQHPPQQPLATKPPPLDLLDSPFDVTLPVASNLPAPPVPRNPEKDALLAAISTALTQTLHNTIAQNNGALPSLQAQHAALSSTYQQIEAELANLNSLNSTLSSNVSTLQESLQKSDRAIASSRERAKRGDVPKVDDVLTAHTVVGKQLYDVVCEERGIEAGIRALQEGLVRGRIGAEVWSRKTRELAREGFRKRVLAQKIGNGMGLDGA